jgi:integrase
MVNNRDCTGYSVTKTSETIAAYSDRAHALRVMAEREECAGTDILTVITWFNRQHERWAASTVRQYRAALRHELDNNHLPASTRELTERRLASGPRPKDGGPRRTSARKRKSLPEGQYRSLITKLRSTRRTDDELILCLLFFGAVLFLRPSEYAHAHVRETTLIVENAKATNGRANGVSRSRDIAPMGQKTIEVLEVFLNELQNAIIETGCPRKLHNRLAARLARVCSSLGIPRVSLYTMRHVGMAMAKSLFSPVEVAAASGHASVRTATSHYAKKRATWVKFRPAGRPTAESISAVRRTTGAFKPPSMVVLEQEYFCAPTPIAETNSPSERPDPFDDYEADLSSTSEPSPWR